MYSQVYWPSDLIQAEDYAGKNAIIIGHNLENSVFVVITTIRFTNIEELLEQNIVKETKHGYELNWEEEDLSIIGILGDAYWWNGLTFKINENKVITNTTSRMIIYDPPNPTMMQFYSIDPISVSLPEKEAPAELKNPAIEQIKEHSDVRKCSPQELHFQNSVQLFNSCWKKRKELLKSFPEMEKSWETHKLWNTILTKLTNTLFVLFTIFHKLPLKSGKFIGLSIVVGLRHIAMIIIKILNHKIAPEFPSLIELSATAQQIDLRLQQFCYSPIQYIRTTRQIDWNATSLAHMQSPVENSLPIEQYPEYIRFYNTLWLVINDVTLGAITGAVLIENQEILIKVFNEIIVSKVLYEDLKKISMWLMNSPGGIKLNNELSMFFSELFTWMIEFWKVSLVDTLVPNLSTVFYILALSSTFGATLSIAIFSDFLSIITFHIYCFYFASARIFNWQLDILTSLFHLFCGQKKNILRNRIDSNDYDLDQLLLGTLLFTVLIFLLPTVFAFYLTFTITRLSILVIVGSLEFVMSCLNHFPIFVILLRLKDYRRTPGGIEFENEQDYLRIKSKPLEVSEMFKPFSNVIDKLKSSYFSFKTLKKILTGFPINVQRNKFYKLLYSALPSNHISTSELWSETKKFL